MAGCGPITTEAQLEDWMISTLTVAWHHQCTVTMETKFAAIPPDGPGLNPAAIMSLGYYLGAGFNSFCNTDFTITEFFGCAKVGDMKKVLADKLGF